MNIETLIVTSLFIVGMLYVWRVEIHQALRWCKEFFLPHKYYGGHILFEPKLFVRIRKGLSN